MFSFRTKLLFSIIFFIIVFAPQGNGETVFIEADGKIGRGITYVRCSRCFIITPGHVAGENRDITIIGRSKATKGIIWQNLLFRQDPIDLAILKVTEDNFCIREQWSLGMGLDEILDNPDEGVLELKQNDGITVERIRVHVKASDQSYIYIEPENKEDSDFIIQGWSGAMLKINGMLSGMLVDVEVDSKTGNVEKGRLYRQDYLTEIINRHVRCPPPTPTPKPTPTPPPIDVTVNIYYSSQRSGDVQKITERLLELGAPVKVVKALGDNSGHYRKLYYFHSSHREVAKQIQAAIADLEPIEIEYDKRSADFMYEPRVTLWIVTK